MEKQKEIVNESAATSATLFIYPNEVLIARSNVKVEILGYHIDSETSKAHQP